jgi:hypothetical protein
MRELIVEDPQAGLALAGSTCRRCGLVAFPFEPFGCERCGAPPPELEATALATHGRVRSVAVVHRHHRTDPPTPFVVVDVALDAGPAVTALLADGGEADAAIGDPVRGVVVDGRFCFTTRAAA